MFLEISVLVFATMFCDPNLDEFNELLRKRNFEDMHQELGGGIKVPQSSIERIAHVVEVREYFERMSFVSDYSLPFLRNPSVKSACDRTRDVFLIEDFNLSPEVLDALMLTKQRTVNVEKTWNVKSDRIGYSMKVEERSSGVILSDVHLAVSFHSQYTPSFDRYCGKSFTFDEFKEIYGGENPNAELKSLSVSQFNHENEKVENVDGKILKIHFPSSSKGKFYTYLRDGTKIEDKTGIDVMIIEFDRPVFDVEKIAIPHFVGDEKYCLCIGASVGNQFVNDEMRLKVLNDFLNLVENVDVQYGKEFLEAMIPDSDVYQTFHEHMDNILINFEFFKESSQERDRRDLVEAIVGLINVVYSSMKRGDGDDARLFVDELCSRFIEFSKNIDDTRAVSCLFDGFHIREGKRIGLSEKKIREGGYAYCSAPVNYGVSGGGVFSYNGELEDDFAYNLAGIVHGRVMGVTVYSPWSDPTMVKIYGDVVSERVGSLSLSDIQRESLEEYRSHFEGGLEWNEL